MPITTSSASHVSQVAHLLDRNITPGHKWFALSNNTLDGTFKVMSLDSIYQVGWWGTSVSDANGTLNIPEKLTWLLDDPMTISILQVIGEPLHDAHPVDFTIKLFDGDGIVLYTETVQDCQTIAWSTQLDQIYEVSSLELEIFKINKAYDGVKLLDIAPPITIVSSDIITVQNTYDSLAANLVVSTDTAKVAQTSQRHVTVNLSSDTTFKVRTENLTEMTNVHTRMDESMRQVFGKVEITYTDPFIDESVRLYASEVGKYTSIESLSDTFENSQFKWFSLHNNKLDATYHPLTLDKKYHIGWWSAQIANNEGYFAQPISIVATFNPRPIHSLLVVGNIQADNYPTEFTIKLFNEVGDLLRTEVVTGNTQSRWIKSIVPVTDVTQMVLEITRINRPGETAKLMEFFTSVVETYYSDNIVDLHVLEEKDYIDSTIQLGAISSNEIDIVLDNTDGRFNVDNPNSTLRTLLKRNRRVRAWLGVEILEGNIEWHPLGTFWTTQWNIPDRSLTASVTARDRLDVLSHSDFATSQLYINYSLYALFDIILRDAGLLSRHYKLDPWLETIVIPYVWFDVMSHRAALQKLAGCAHIELYCDRMGRIIIGPITQSDTVFYTFDDDKNVIKKDYPFAWSEITNYVEVLARNYVPDTDSNVLEVLENIALEPMQEFTVKYTFNTIPVLSPTSPVLDCDPGITMVQHTTYAWGIELTIRNDAEEVQSLRGITVTGQPLKLLNTNVLTAKDEVLIRDNGMLKTTIEHEFIQSSIYAQNLANYMLTSFRESRYDVDLENRGNIALQLGHRVLVQDPNRGNLEYAVKRQTIDWNGFLSARVEGKRLE